MRFAIGMGRDGAEERLEKRGVSRRDFLKFCTAVAVTMAWARLCPQRGCPRTDGEQAAFRNLSA